MKKYYNKRNKIMNEEKVKVNPLKSNQDMFRQYVKYAGVENADNWNKASDEVFGIPFFEMFGLYIAELQNRGLNFNEAVKQKLFGSYYFAYAVVINQVFSSSDLCSNIILGSYRINLENGWACLVDIGHFLYDPSYFNRNSSTFTDEDIHFDIIVKVICDQISNIGYDPVTFPENLWRKQIESLQ